MRRSLKFLLPPAVILLFALALQLYLVLTGWQPGPEAGYMQFGYRTGIPAFDEDGLLEEGKPVKVRLFEPDPDLFWKPISNTPFTNSQGFRGNEEYPEKKIPGTTRILFLADSTAFLGDPPYPALITDPKIECINASVPGYSTFQGLNQLKRLAHLEPDYVCICFGWNDHWPARGGLTDDAQQALSMDLKLLCFIKLMVQRVLPGHPYRVPPIDFEKNLSAMRDLVLEWNAVPILITAPSGFEAGNMPPWAVQFFGEFYGMNPAQVQAIPHIHRAYADAVKEASRKGGCLLIEALSLFEPHLFRNDGIHFNGAGHERMATLITDLL